MLTFHPSRPFPIFEPTEQSESSARAHAAEVDAWLGLRISDVESALATSGSRLPARTQASRERQELWFGLDARLLLTPYAEIRALLERLTPIPGETIVDLGAAYGRMAFVIARHFPGVKFIGYEYVGERVQEGAKAFARWRLLDCRIDHVNLAAPIFRPAVAEVYFLYDYGTPKAIEKTLYDLKAIARDRTITVVARGRHSRALIAERHSWLEPKVKREAETRATIYRSVDEERSKDNRRRSRNSASP